MGKLIFIQENQEFVMNGVVFRWEKSNTDGINLVSVRVIAPILTCELDVEATIQAAVDREDYEYAAKIKKENS